MAKFSVGALHALSLFSCCLSATINDRQQMIPLPALPGPLSVGTISLEMIDTSRQEPYVTTPQHRAIMVSLFYPTSDTNRTHATYLPPDVAKIADEAFHFPSGFLESIQPQSYLNARLKEIPDIPIILFSPGLGAVREEYTILLEGLASYGYLVIAMDHTYDGSLVEFPDGSRSRYQRRCRLSRRPHKRFQLRHRPDFQRNVHGPNPWNLTQ